MAIISLGLLKADEILCKTISTVRISSDQGHLSSEGLCAYLRKWSGSEPLCWEKNSPQCTSSAEQLSDNFYVKKLPLFLTVVLYNTHGTHSNVLDSLFDNIYNVGFMTQSCLQSWKIRQYTQPWNLNMPMGQHFIDPHYFKIANLLHRSSLLLKGSQLLRRPSLFYDGE